MEQKLIGTSNRDTVMAFLECFCGGNIEGLAFLLDEGLQVRGPLKRFSSRAQYLDSLRAEPPEVSDYDVLSVTEGNDSVAVFYNYGKSSGTLTVAQFFRFNNHLITEMRLVFDTDGMAQP